MAVTVYLELTRRQLAERLTNHMPPGINKQQRAKLKTQVQNAAGDMTEALNSLSADGWELVTFCEAKSYGGEILYVFKKTI